MAAAGLVVTAVVALPAVVPVAASREAASAEVSELVLIVLPNLGQVSESVEALPAKAAAELALAVLPKTDDWEEVEAVLVATAVFPTQIAMASEV